jgi:hypothetical protein
VASIHRAVYQINISLREIEPSIWRRIQLWGDMKLPRLHRLFQLLFQWEDRHLHEFVTARHVYRQPHPDDHLFGKAIEDDSVVQINHVLPHVGDELDYVYDFGDGWRHRVVLEAILLPEAGVLYPRCVAGERKGPPEDVGGPRAYTDFLRRKLRNGSLPSTDSENFSADDINRVLQRAFHRKPSKTATSSVIK